MAPVCDGLLIGIIGTYFTNRVSDYLFNERKIINPNIISPTITNIKPVSPTITNIKPVSHTITKKSSNNISEEANRINNNLTEKKQNSFISCIDYSLLTTPLSKFFSATNLNKHKILMTQTIGYFIGTTIATSVFMDKKRAFIAAIFFTQGTNYACFSLFGHCDNQQQIEKDTFLNTAKTTRMPVLPFLYKTILYGLITNIIMPSKSQSHRLSNRRHTGRHPLQEGIFIVGGLHFANMIYSILSIKNISSLVNIF